MRRTCALICLPLSKRAVCEQTCAVPPSPFDSARRLPLQVSSETLPCHNGSVGTRRNKGKDAGWGPVWAWLEPKSVPLPSPPSCERGCVDAVRCEDTAVLPVAAGKYLPRKKKSLKSRREVMMKASCFKQLWKTTEEDQREDATTSCQRWPLLKRLACPKVHAYILNAQCFECMKCVHSEKQCTGCTLKMVQ